MKTKNDEFRIISQLQYRNDEDKTVTLNAGEMLPEKIINNKLLIETLLEQGRICRIGKNGENIVAECELDEQGREVFGNNYLTGLISPTSVHKAIKILQEHKVSLKNLEAMNEKIESVLSTVDSPILKMLQNEVVRQLYEIKILNCEN